MAARQLPAPPFFAFVRPVQGRCSGTAARMRYDAPVFDPNP